MHACNLQSINRITNGGDKHALWKEIFLQTQLYILRHK